MQKRVNPSCFMFAVVFSCMLLLTSECAVASEAEILLFMGKYPRPRSGGADAYKDVKKRFETLLEWGPDTATMSLLRLWVSQRQHRSTMVILPRDITTMKNDLAQWNHALECVLHQQKFLKMQLTQ